MSYNVGCRTLTVRPSTAMICASSEAAGARHMGEVKGTDGQPADLWIDAEGMVRNSTTTLFAADVLAMPGSHNRQNLLLVTAAALAVGLSPQQIAASLSTFPGVPHRLEHLGTLAGANVFNDSKATNYDAAEVGLKAMQGPVVVLAGGQTKRGDASGWMKTLETRACSLILFGAGAEELANLAKAAGYPGELLQCQELETAVNLAAVAVQRQGASALLLLGLRRFDQYRFRREASTSAPWCTSSGRRLRQNERNGMHPAGGPMMEVNKPCDVASVDESEPDAYGIDDLRREETTLWDGIRNYQAQFHAQNGGWRPGFFYHSNCKPPGSSADGGNEQPRRPQFDPTAKYYDPKSTSENHCGLCSAAISRIWGPTESRSLRELIAKNSYP